MPGAVPTRPRYIRQELRDGRTLVYKLKPSLYGLSQSPALWNDTLDKSLTVFGWKSTQSDPCVYMYASGNIIVILTVYVDDVLITRGGQQLMDQKKEELTDRFEMTDMGEVKRILGIDVERDNEQETLAISQEHYVNTLLDTERKFPRINLRIKC
ncbi:unnamed protein product [Ectocarpus sp. CCAP 1310/34]|nr:unnamed protein product [Ectocarpus sp. CCAP 1310/34]